MVLGYEMLCIARREGEEGGGGVKHFKPRGKDRDVARIFGFGGANFG